MSFELIYLEPLLWGLGVLALLAGALRFTLVDRPRIKWLAAFGLRAAGILLLLLALCRPLLLRTTDDVHVVFLVDVSESVDLGAARGAVEDVKEAIEALRPGDSWSLLAVGRGVRSYEKPAALEEVLDQWAEGASDDRFRSATRLGEALRRARAWFPEEKSKRVVLLTDGHPTDGSGAEAVETLREEGVDLRLWEIEGLQKPEAAVVSMEPSRPSAYQGEVVRMDVRLATNRPMAGELRAVHKGVIVQRKDVQLDPDGENRATLDVRMTSPGASRWRVELAPEEDHFPINNQAAATVTVRGQPRILVLHEERNRMRDFARAMRKQDFAVDLRTPRGLPTQMQDLLAFDAVILAKTPATAISSPQMNLLRRFVSDFGGGLAMLGSEESFGLGGYYQTPVEEVLPLVSRFEKEKQKPSVAMVLVIDKSGSMQGLPISLARQAAKATVELLGPRDQIAVVAFDSQAYIISQMRSATDRAAIKSAIDSLAAGGGTMMYPGMETARRLLENTSAMIKHTIVLSDGRSQPADHEGLTVSMADAGITVSTVALGGSADRALLSRLAEIGNGRYYETMDPTNVPQIFTKETMQASRSAIKEDVFGTVRTGDHPLLAGFSEASLPVVLGYVMTRSKPTARVLLSVQTGDPLLAVSRYGLGTGMAYTSDLTPRWGAQWMAWPDFGKFWAQALRSVVRKPSDRGLHTETRTEDGKWVVEITRKNDAGEPVNGIDWDAKVLDGSGTTDTVEVQEVGLGRYRAEVDLTDRDRATLRLFDRDHDKMKVLHYDRPYPAEYRLGQEIPEPLAKLPSTKAAEIRAGLEPADRRRDIRWAVYLLAIACFISGIFLRRV